MKHFMSTTLATVCFLTVPLASDAETITILPPDVRLEGDSISGWLPGQLRKLLAETDAEISKSTEAINVASKIADDYNYGRPWKGTPEWERWSQEHKWLEAECPRGVTMPIAKVRECSDRIDRFNAWGKTIERQVLEKLTDRDNIIALNTPRIQRLTERKNRLQEFLRTLMTCNNMETVARRACLDVLFDSQASTGAIVTVQLPDAFGGKKRTVQEIVQLYKARGDASPSQIQPPSVR